MIELLEKELSFEDKQKIVRAVIEKVEATSAEATIYGRIPIFEGIDNDLITFNEKEVKVSFELKSRNCGSSECWEVNSV